MSDENQDVLPTIDVKTHLNTYLKQVRQQGVGSQPIFFGAHRKREAVITSAVQYDELLDTIRIQGELLGELTPGQRIALEQIAGVPSNPIVKALAGLIEAINRGERPSVLIDFDALEAAQHEAADTALLADPDLAESLAQMRRGEGRVLVPLADAEAGLVENDPAADELMAALANGDCGSPAEPEPRTEENTNELSPAERELLLRVIEEWESEDFTRDLQVRIPVRALAERLAAEKKARSEHFAARMQILRAQARTELKGRVYTEAEVRDLVKSVIGEKLTSAVENLVDDIDIATTVRQRLSQTGESASLADLAERVDLDPKDFEDYATGSGAE